jgi:hypothetical protein
MRSGFKGSRVHEFRVQGFKGSGFKGSGFKGFRVQRVQGSKGSGFMSSGFPSSPFGLRRAGRVRVIQF